MIIQKLNKSTFVIGLAGFFVALYALILHVKNLMAPGGGSICDVSATVNCSAVIGSRFGEFASIPLGSYGMAYFAIVLAAALTPKFAQMTYKQLAQIELFIAAIGLIVVAILMTISYGILKIVCPTCSIIHGLVIIYALLKIYEFIKFSKTNDTVQINRNDSYLVFFATALCLAIPPLMVGLFSPLLVNYFGKSATKTKHAESAAKISNTLHTDLMSFNKSNYIGNGEDYRRGDDNAPVVVQMFSDFGCPHCKTANESLMKAQDIVGLDKVVLVYRFYPLSNECNSFVGAKGWYNYNCSLVVAARCAGQQDKFWEFKEWAFDGQNWTDQERAKNFSPEGLKTEAKNLKINTDSFIQCISGHTEDDKIRDDIILANQLNIQGTPMIVINGTLYKGPLDTQTFVQQFSNALEKEQVQ